MAAVAVGLLYPNTSPLVETPPHGRADVYRAPAAVRLTAAERRLVLATAARFVETAVRREHPERAWQLAAPGLRAGTTEADWRAGEIPVVPYPVGEARWKVDYAYAGEVGLQVAVFPERLEAVGAGVFDMALRKVGRRWLVASWSPHGGGGSRARGEEGAPFALGAPAPSASTRLGPGWLLVPVVLLGLGLATPLAVLLGRRSRKVWRNGDEHHSAEPS